MKAEAWMHAKSFYILQCVGRQIVTVLDSSAAWNPARRVGSLLHSKHSINVFI